MNQLSEAQIQGLKDTWIALKKVHITVNNCQLPQDLTSAIKVLVNGALQNCNKYLPEEWDGDKAANFEDLIKMTQIGTEAIEFARFRDEYKKTEREGLQKEIKRVGRMFSFMVADDEQIYCAFRDFLANEKKPEPEEGGAGCLT